VVRGYYRSFASLREGVHAAVRALLAREPSVDRLLVTGHSLGAAQSVYGAAELALSLPHLPVTLYAFGLPRPGDRRFSSWLNSSLPNLQAWAVAHRQDSVPEFIEYDPRHPGSYHSIATNVWYPDGLLHPPPPLGYIICDGSGEDPLCENGHKPASGAWVHEDHEWYLNHSMWCCDSQPSAPAMKPTAGCIYTFPVSARTAARASRRS